MDAKRRYELLVAFTVLAGTLFVASLAWACTLLVGSTQTTTPAGGFGDSVQATGEVVHAVEDLSPQCQSADGETNCDYNLLVVDPDDAVTGDQAPGGSSSCHYDTHERGIADYNPNERPDPTGSATVLETDDGTVPRRTEDGGSMGTGPTVMCYASEQPNQRDNGPATATQPVPFLVTD